MGVSLHCLSLRLFSWPFSWLHSESAHVLCWIQSFLFHLVLSWHRMAFPPGKELVGFMHVLYQWVVLVCFPKMSSEVNFNNYLCSGVFPSKHSHVYLWRANYARPDAGDILNWSFQRCSIFPNRLKLSGVPLPHFSCLEPKKCCSSSKRAAATNVPPDLVQTWRLSQSSCGDREQGRSVGPCICMVLVCLREMNQT